MKNRPQNLRIIVIIVVVCGIIFGVFPGLYRQIRNHPLRDPDAFRIISWKSLFSEAIELASNWNEDAFLYRISMSVVINESIEANEIYFYFNSKSEPIWLGIAFKEGNSGIDVEIHEGQYNAIRDHGDWPPQRPRVDIENIISDSQEAFVILHENGGNDYLSKYGDKDYRITLILEPRSENALQWRALYSIVNDSLPRPVWNIIMDAQTNKLLKPDIYGEN